MSTPTSPQRVSAAALRRASWPDQGMRVSDADRADVADRLAKHYSHGRLDQAEFDERLDRAMNAKTRADLVVLLADLPEGEPPPDDGTPSRNQRRQQRLILKAQLERERLMLRQERQEHRRRQREMHWHGMRQLLVIIAMVVALLIVVRLLRDIYSVWLIIAILAFLWLRTIHSRRGSGNGPGSGPDGPEDGSGNGGQ
jgi:hypothetical protein